MPRPDIFRSGPLNVLGLNSGTSIDALDWALVELRGETPRWRVVDTGSKHIPKSLQRGLFYAADAEDIKKETLVRTDVAFGDWLGEAVNGLLRQELRGQAVDMVASHGQTVGHWPYGGIGATLQIGDPDQIAKGCGLPVVSHFRQGDVAAGGEGAPLTPAVNRILFARPKRTIAVLNLGGIANLSIIPPRLSRRHVVGTDCGPANVLLDLAARTHLGRPQDPSGRHAMQGEIEGPFLTALKRNTWFKRSLPASCGREEFNEDFLSKAVKKGNVQHSADLLATLCAFSAWGVQRALRELDAVPHTIFASGGGVHNVRLMAEIEEAVAPIPLQSATRLGVHPDALEAVSFALLGYMSVRRKAIDLRGATGARRPAVLGRVTWP